MALRSRKILKRSELDSLVKEIGAYQIENFTIEGLPGIKIIAHDKSTSYHFIFEDIIEHSFKEQIAKLPADNEDFTRVENIESETPSEQATDAVEETPGEQHSEESNESETQGSVNTEA